MEYAEKIIMDGIIKKYCPDLLKLFASQVDSSAEGQEQPLSEKYQSKNNPQDRGRKSGGTVLHTEPKSRRQTPLASAGQKAEVTGNGQA